MNTPLCTRLQPRLILAKDFAAERPFRNVKAREFATALAERDDAVEAADKADIELRPGPCAQKVAQLREYKIMAGKHRQRRVGLFEDCIEFLLNFGRRAFQMRREACADAFAIQRSLSPKR